MELTADFPQQEKFQLSTAVQTLMGLFLGGTDPDKLLSASAELLGTPVCFLENAIFHQASPQIAPIHFDMPLLQQLYHWGDTQNTARSDFPCLIPSNLLPQPTFFPGGSIYSPVMQKDQLLGHFFVLGTGEPLDSLALSLTPTITDMLATLMGASAFSSHNRGIPNLSLFYALLNGEQVDQSLLKAIINQFPFPAERQLYILVLGGADMSEDQLKQLRDGCGTMISCSMQVLYQGYAVLLYHGREKYPLTENHNFLAFLTDRKANCGVSRVCTGYSDIPHGFAQARAALLLGSSLSPGKCLFLYDDYALFHALSLASRFISVEDLLSPKLQTLIQYDSKKGTELLTTLQVYLNNINNLNRAAEQLNIHRNTLFYRLKKIEDITGWDFDCGDDLAHVTFNLQVFRFIQTI